MSPLYSIEKKLRQIGEMVKARLSKCSRSLLALLFTVYISTYTAACLFIGITALREPTSAPAIQPIGLRPPPYYEHADSISTIK